MEIGGPEGAGGQLSGKWGGCGGRNLSSSSHSPSALCWLRREPAPRSSCWGASSPSPVVFTVGSPPSGTTPPQGPRTTMFSGEDRLVASKQQ